MPLTISKTVRPNAVWQEMYLQISKDQRVIINDEQRWTGRPGKILGGARYMALSFHGPPIALKEHSPHHNSGCNIGVHQPHVG